MAQDRGRLEGRIELLAAELETQKKQNERDNDALKIKTKIIDDQTETIRKLKEVKLHLFLPSTREMMKAVANDTGVQNVNNNLIAINLFSFPLASFDYLNQYFVLKTNNPIIQEPATPSTVCICAF